MSRDSSTAEPAPACVAHVIHHLASGGAERRLLTLLGSLDRARFEPILVCIDRPGELADQARELGIEPIVLERAHRRDVSGIWRLARLLRTERVTVVHGWLPFANLFSRVAGVLAGTPVRIAAEGVMGAVNTSDARKAQRYNRIDRLLTRVTDAYVVNSHAVAGTLRARGVATGKIVVIPNGVALGTRLSPLERGRLRAELGAARNSELVGMIARLDSSQKDHATFLDAVALLTSEGRDIHAAVVGEGDDRKAIEQHARELGIADRVVFTGHRADSTRLVGVLDVSVMLSRTEGFSNVVLESMAAGVPLVATSIPPNAEAIEDGIHGLLVPTGDVPETAGALRRLLDDRALAERLGTEARRRAIADFSLEAQAQATMHLYERLIEERGERRARPGRGNAPSRRS